ncbi:AMP-binding protein [uncultured Roseovarius sp.]|uniref:AMP-binding protein n=1 Tax=uncultured Roseovarius sp. TaxID=293344 RepID=UPI00263296F1|nr:AMP-binding protein [uncultured Roseovarius sp.]
MRLRRDTPPEGTLRDWIDARAEAGGPAMSFPDEGTAIDWPELRARARSIAALLTAKGALHGESVAILQPNGQAAIEALYGALYGGFRATMINLVAGAEAIGYALAHSGARVALVHPAQHAMFQRVTSGDTITALDMTEQMPCNGLHPVAPSDHALLMYTSGTTGRPKGVVHTQSSLLAGGWTTTIAHDLSAKDTGLCVLPVYHINGLCVSVMGSLVSGGQLAMCGRFSASRFWAQAAETRATWFSVVPTIISHLLHGDTAPDPETRARLRFGRSASSPLPVEVHTAFEARFDVPIIETMGLTETSAQILSNPLPPAARKIGSPGIAYGNQAQVAGPDMRPLPPGQEGEIIVKGPNVMLEYLRNPEATRDSFTPDGWLRTGDLGRKDAEGYFYVTGRLKELIIKGGENIAPREIDEVLYAHPDVVEAAAFSRPCPQYGERVEAAVAVTPGSALTSDDLMQLCKDRLGAFKCPDRIYFLDELPKGPSGKIQRVKLKDLLNPELERNP